MSRQQVYGKDLSWSPIGRYLQDGGTTKSPMRKKTILFKSDFVMVNACKNCISSKSSIPYDLFAGYRQRHKSRCCKYDLQTKLSCYAQSKIRSAQFSHRQSTRSNHNLGHL